MTFSGNRCQNLQELDVSIPEQKEENLCTRSPDSIVRLILMGVAQGPLKPLPQERGVLNDTSHPGAGLHLADMHVDP